MLVKLKQSLKESKLTLLLALLFLPTVQISAAKEIDKEMTKLVTLSVKKIPLNQLIWELKKQTGITFTYNTDDVVKITLNELNVTNRPVYEVLDLCLKDTGLEYKRIEGVVVIAKKKTNSTQPKPQQSSQHLNLKGYVTDTNGEPLIGVVVTIPDSGKGVVTDMDGNYVLTDVLPGQVVSFRYLGKKTIEKKIDARLTTLNITLLDQEYVLQNVVVTGYQTLSKERSAGSFSIIKGSDITGKAAISGSILNSLEGFAPGLNINMGSSGDKFLIRGITSVNADRTPLFIVDGVPVSSDMVETMISSNDVKSVSVLKDATAASIWGARAANGVLVITTKSGERNGKIQISYNGSFTYEGKPDFGYLDMMDSKSFIKTAIELFDPVSYPLDRIKNTTTGEVYPHEIPLYKHHLGEISDTERDNTLALLASHNGRKEYEKYFMDNAFINNHAVSLSGGTTKQSYYISAGYIKRQRSDKISSNEYKIFAKNRIDITNWLNIDLALNAMYGENKGHKRLRSIYYSDTNMLPYSRFKDENGNPISFTQYTMNEDVQKKAENISGIHLDYYPIKDFNESIDKANYHNIRAHLGLTVKLFDGLKYNGLFQYYINSMESERFDASDSFAVRLNRVYATSKDGTQHLPNEGGNFFRMDSKLKSYTMRNQLDYDKSLGANHENHITALAGMEIISSLKSDVSNSIKGYNPHTMSYLEYDAYDLHKNGVSDPVLDKPGNFGVNKFPPNSFIQNEDITRFVSMYASAAYTYIEKYSINGNIRIDRSNAFGNDPGNQYNPIWSLGGVWNMKKEKFMSNLQFLNQLNLRLSYGYAGNTPTSGQGGRYNVIRSTADHKFYPGIYNNLGMAYHIYTAANDKLTWERTRTWNVGLDYYILNNRLGGTIDLYNKKTTDLISKIPFDPITGVSEALSPNTNAGEMINKGIEVSLNARIISSENIGWDASLSFAYNKNELLKFYTDPPKFAYMLLREKLHEGRPINPVFAYRWAGLDPETGHSRIYSASGDIITDVNKVKSEDIHYKGTATPPYNASLRTSFRFKDWLLSCMFICNAGHKMRNDVNRQYTGRLTENVHKDLDKRWRKPGDEKHTDVPAYYSQIIDGYDDSRDLLYGFSDINVLDASYIKLRDLSLSYNLPARFSKALSMSKVRISVYATDLFMIAFNGEGIDPEASTFGGSRVLKKKPSGSINISVDF